jgi:hypothetical protein
MCNSRSRHSRSFVAATWLLIFACAPISVGRAQKAEKSKKTSAKGAPTADKFNIVAAENGEGKLLSRLRKPVSFEWQDVPLPEALALLKSATKVTFAVDEKDLEENDLDPRVTVSGSWKGRPVEDVLGEVLTRANLDYIVDGEKLVVVSLRRATAAPVEFTYDVKRLCPDDASLGRLKRAIYRAGPEFEWEPAGGFASVAEDPAQRTLTIKHTWSRHAEIRNAMRKFGSDD